MLTPLADALRTHVLAADVVHTDDTPLPVLAPGLGKTKAGRVWTYVCDGRPAAGQLAPAFWFAYSPDRKSEHPQRHLENFSGILQSDGYAGYSKICEGGRVLEAASWALVRRVGRTAPVPRDSPDPRSDRRALCYRASDSRSYSRRASRGSARTQPPSTRRDESFAGADARNALAEIRDGKGDPLCAGSLGSRGMYCDDGRIEIDNNTALGYISAGGKAIRCVTFPLVVTSRGR